MSEKRGLPSLAVFRALSSLSQPAIFQTHQSTARGKLYIIVNNAACDFFSPGAVAGRVGSEGLLFGLTDQLRVCVAFVMVRGEKAVGHNGNKQQSAAQSFLKSKKSIHK